MAKFKVGDRALVENEVVTIDDIMQSEKGGVYYAVTFENGNEEGFLQAVSYAFKRLWEANQEE